MEAGQLPPPQWAAEYSHYMQQLMGGAGLPGQQPQGAVAGAGNGFFSSSANGDSWQQMQRFMESARGAAYVQWAQGATGMGGFGSGRQGNPLLGFGNSNPYGQSNSNPNSLMSSAPNPFGMHMPPAYAKSKADFTDLMHREVGDFFVVVRSFVRSFCLSFSVLSGSHSSHPLL